MQNSLLDFKLISLVRRNHGLEHATLNLLAKKHPGVPFSGHSDQKGFWVIGNISTDELLETAQSALQRMKDGEKSLAVHANCGTNLVTSGLLAGTLAWLATLGKRDNFKKKLDQWPLLVMIITGTLIAAQPLGLKVQEKITTSGSPDQLMIKQIIRFERSGPIMHHILTSEASN